MSIFNSHIHPLINNFYILVTNVFYCTVKHDKCQYCYLLFISTYSFFLKMFFVDSKYILLLTCEKYML